jgi:hypothetical protein
MRRVLEVVDGVPIAARVPDPLAMEPGNRGRFEPKGQVYEVDRVSEGAAYLHKVHDPPLVREIGRAELDTAVEQLLGAISRGDPASCYSHAVLAAQAAHAYRRIEAHRGSAEPGVARSARFREVA